MKCPLKAYVVVTSSEFKAETQRDCLKAECAWWNERFGMCSQAVPAYLSGVADSRAEARAEMQERKG